MIFLCIDWCWFQRRSLFFLVDRWWSWKGFGSVWIVDLNFRQFQLDYRFRNFQRYADKRYANIRCDFCYCWLLNGYSDVGDKVMLVTLWRRRYWWLFIHCADDFFNTKNRHQRLKFVTNSFCLQSLSPLSMWPSSIAGTRMDCFLDNFISVESVH